jgi:hypothetical protein
MSSKSSSCPEDVEAAQSSGETGAEEGATYLGKYGSEDDRDDSIPERANISKLIAEVKEANRLLKILVGEKHPERSLNKLEFQEGLQTFEEDKEDFEAYTETELREITLAHIQTVEKAEDFRGHFLSKFTSWYQDDVPGSEEQKREHAIYHAYFADSRRLEASLRVRANLSTSLVVQQRKMRRARKQGAETTVTPVVAAKYVEKLVYEIEAQWPLDTAAPIIDLHDKDQIKAYIHWKHYLCMPSNFDYEKDGTLQAQEDSASVKYYVRLMRNLE